TAGRPARRSPRSRKKPPRLRSGSGSAGPLTASSKRGVRRGTAMGAAYPGWLAWASPDGYACAMDSRALYHSIGSARRFWAGVELAGRVAMGDAPAQLAMRKIARLLEEEGIPYAVAGALALGQPGYLRATVDVDLLLNRDG